MLSGSNPAQVAWQGRFRLEGLEVYRGLAWWAAEVVEKNVDEDDSASGSQHRRDAASLRPRSGSWGRLQAISEGLNQQDGYKLRRYKVHYLNWDARWDEWVTREQLRWPVNEGELVRVRSQTFMCVTLWVFI